MTLMLGVAILSAFGGATALASVVGGPDIIAAPASIIDDPPGATNDHQQAFDEAQGVLLAANLTVDGGIIPAGTVVDSHMIFLNTDGNTFATDNQTWTFDGFILGVMSDQSGTLEVASSALLGAPGTVYPAAPFNARGMESNDSYLVAGNQITVVMSVTEPGDWIRVVTAAVIDVEIDIKPGSFPNSINPNSKGVIPVAILTTGDFDATTVDASTVEFGPNGAAIIHQNAHLEDVDGDGDIDMVLHFRTQDTGIAHGDTEASLSGETFDGVDILGTDSIRTVPE
jgi:hypothetical protein